MAAESLFKCLEQIPDPPRARGVRHPFQPILRLTLLGLVISQTTMAHIARFGQLNWDRLKNPRGFVRDQAPHATTISRTLAGVPFGLQLQAVLIAWMQGGSVRRQGGVPAGGIGGRQVGQAIGGCSGNPLGLVNVLTHDLKLAWPSGP